jgi:hypothetical protein
LKGKPRRIYISKNKWNETKHTIRNGIIKKLSAAKQNISIDMNIAAGIYMYALEEFGKLLLLKDCKLLIIGNYIIIRINFFICITILGKLFTR